MFDSVGLLWAFVTAALGFKPFRHEGKVTGLAGHGDPAKTLPIFEAEMGLVEDPVSGRWRIRARWSAEETGNFQLYLAHLEGGTTGSQRAESFRLAEELGRHAREDVAAGLQRFTEQLLLRYLERNGFAPSGFLPGGRRLRQRAPEHARARGVAGCAARLRLPQHGRRGPLCGGGVARVPRARAPRQRPKGQRVPRPRVRGRAGARGARPPRRRRGAPRPPRVRPGRGLAPRRGSRRGPSAMEFGPRALGHRSLLSRATDPGVGAALNSRLRRTEFMPFAPATLRPTHATGVAPSLGVGLLVRAHWGP
ncbi:unnamed protein product, partial [Prorocentrum cordatum]